MTNVHSLRVKPPDTPSAAEGTRRMIDGRERVFYDGYWIKTYPAPADTLEAKKRLIEALTRRLFNHTEHGLNIPGQRLDEARQSYLAEADPARQRVKGAMLAGALLTGPPTSSESSSSCRRRGSKSTATTRSCASAESACSTP